MHIAHVDNSSNCYYRYHYYIFIDTYKNKGGYRQIEKKAIELQSIHSSFLSSIVAAAAAVVGTKYGGSDAGCASNSEIRKADVMVVVMMSVRIVITATVSAW